MRTLIKGGTIVTAEQEYVGDILVEGDVIRAMGTHLDEAADLVIDAKGKYVFPGGVDQHTHFSALCNVGNRDTAGYETTDSAIVGGTTTIVDFAPQDPDRGLLDSIDYRINVRAKDKSCVDFALHSMVTYIMDSIFDEIEEFPRRGISSIKIFMAYNGSPLHVAALSPISSYGPFITGLIAAELLASGVEGNEWGIWLNMLPFNLYGVFAMVSVLIVAAFGLNFGPMYKEEKRARETGKLLDDGVQPLVPEVKNELPADYKLTMWNFIIPIVCLFGSLFATIFWSGDLVNNGLVGCFRSANITLAICIAFMGGALGAGIMGVSTKLFSVTKAFDTFVNGMAELISVPFILVCAWSLGSIVKGMGTSEFLIHIVEQYLTPGMVPALVFLFGALISFSTGSSWGVWSIMMPIAFPMAVAFDISIPFVVGAVIGGGLFGDQCSPISDTTVLSSTGASCNHIVHVMTQIPYGVTVGISAFVGFLFGGLTGQYVLSIAVTAAILTVSLFTLTQLTKRRYPEKVH